jgi:hypothetical protein
MKYEMAASSQLQSYLSKNDAALLPIGTLEVHGPHLPYGTDTAIVQAICLLMGQQSELMVLPPVWYSFTDTTNELPGTVHISLETAARYTKEVCLSLIANGFKRVMMLNIHGRNELWLGGVAAEVFEKTNVPVLAVDPYTCFSAELDHELLGQIDNHTKENLLARAAYEILQSSDHLIDPAESVTVLKPASLSRLLSVGKVGYFYNREEEHIAPRRKAALDVSQGISYLEQVAIKLIAVIEDLGDYRDYVKANPRRGKKK